MSDNDMADKFSGCLLGGAVGDALGWPVEFLSMVEIRRKFGPDGIQDFAETAGGVGSITDDTQMTLFTAEGLVREYKGVGTHTHLVPRSWFRCCAASG